MKRLLLFVITLVAAVFLGLWLKSDPGYILVSYKNWTAETSLWFGIIVLAASFFIIYQSLHWLNILLASRGNILRWYREKRFLKAHSITAAGLLAFCEGEWEEAEDLLINGAKSSRISLINYIFAARAAQESDNEKRRDQYLAKAMTLAEGYEKIAVKLTEARLQIDRHDYQSAEILLQELHSSHSAHRYTLKLLTDVYTQTEQWDKLQAILPQLKKHRVFNRAALSVLQKQLANQAH